ncbi:MAG: ABC transporter substrate-binding protein [Planctomycetes bacterium RBG_16_64_10]|nr:MAG: ABC transporter substrate-binding protein [Planctomycetes bacterium RBG_16_64_10]
MIFLRLRTWRLGLRSMVLHPLRSALTVLGIFIGVASVIWLLAIGEGISRQAQEQIASLGAENIIVRTIKPPNEALAGQRGLIPYGLRRDDFLRLLATVPTIERALPIRELRRQFRYKDRLLDGRLVGCTPAYAEVTRLQVDRGHFITDAEVREEKNHCVLAAEVAARLFPVEDPIGRAIRLETDYYVVVGVLKPRSPTAGIGGSLEAQDFSKDVYIPITNLWRWIGDAVATIRAGSFEGETVELSQITLQVDEVAHVLQTANVVENLLERGRNLKDYGMTIPLELLEQARTMRMMFIILLGLIAAISLVVGGIGIMNIMLATVTERTREIGIRRALGAKRRDITGQFLAETVALSVAGGLTGIVGGLTCGPTVRWIREMLYRTLPDLMEDLPGFVRTVSPEVVPWSIPLAFGISVGVGVVFGMYPAVRAARMDPIEALRHE